MAQSSAAREPTMEEILASIRRIIESNDESAPPRVEPRPQLASIAGSAEGAAAAPTLETATITEARPAKAPAGDAAVPAISLADVAARLRGRDDRPAPAPAASTPPTVANDDRFAAAEEPETDAAETLSAAGFETFESEPDDEPEPADADQAEASDDEPWGAADRRFETAEAPSQRVEQREASSSAFDLGEPLHKNEAASSAAETAPHTGTGGSSALVSMETGTKVAAAFDDLNSAISEGRMRSFEELAQELLRPMLSEWLDDNLPTLVERLVREEIERVARGGRR